MNTILNRVDNEKQLQDIFTGTMCNSMIESYNSIVGKNLIISFIAGVFCEKSVR